MNRPKISFWLSSKGLVVLCAIGFIAYFLWMEHRQHLVEWLPYLIILLCPLMHIFMHGGHSHGDDNDHKHHHESENEAYRRGLEDGRKNHQR